MVDIARASAQIRGMRASILVCLIGCGGGGQANVDAPEGIDAPDIDAPEVDAARPPASHRVFLSFEGQVLSPAAADDALLDHWSQAPAVTSLTQWALGAADRATRIQAVTAEVSAILAPFDIDVVTTRPTTGTYHMVVFTHLQSQDIGLAANQLVVAAPLCGANPSQVAVVFRDSETSSFPHAASISVVVELGQFFGVESSAVSGDCMCKTANTVVCTQTAACTIGGAGTTRADASTCGTSGGTFDENAEFLANIGVHP
jgi:hypothetical protein